MERKDFEVRTNIKFLVKLGWKGTEIIHALQTVYFGGNCCHIHIIAQTLLHLTFFLFPKLKEHLKGVRFNDTNEAQQAAKTWLAKWSADYFINGIKGWKHRLEKCMDLDGDYVEN